MSRRALPMLALLGLVAACARGAARRPTSTPPAGSAPAVRLGWARQSASIRCRATGTELPVPQRWRSQVRPLDADTLAIVASDARDALVIRVGREADPVRDLLADWARLHRLVAPDVGEDATVRVALQVQGNRVSVDYVVPEHPEQAFRLAYTRVARNGATCRIAALQRVASGVAAGLAALIDDVRDAPALDFAGPRPAPEDTGWSLLLGFLRAGAQIASLFRGV